MKCAKSVFVLLGFALLSPFPFPLIPAAHAQTQHWITQFGTIERDGAGTIAPDGAGGVFICGSSSLERLKGKVPTPLPPTARGA